MFDREEALAHWRERMLEKEAIQESDLVELEDHLVEQSEDLQANGLTEEESFFVAARRLGDPLKLNAEYQKVSPGAVVRQRLFWMLVGGVCYVLLFQLLWLLNGLAGLTYALLAPPPPGGFSAAYAWLGGAASLAATALLAGLFFLVYGRGHIERSQNLFRQLATKPFRLLVLLLGVGAATKLLPFALAVLLRWLVSGPRIVVEVRTISVVASWGLSVVLFVVMTVLLCRLGHHRVDAAPE